MSIFDQFSETLTARHATQVTAGLHDGGCEWRENGYWICNCSKRKREAEGYTTPPGDLIFEYPTCPRCHKTVDHDGDSFSCENCKCRWDSSGQDATFNDDHGDLDPTEWDKAAAEKAKADLLATAMADPEGHRLADAAVALAGVKK